MNFISKVKKFLCWLIVVFVLMAYAFTLSTYVFKPGLALDMVLNLRVRAASLLGKKDFSAQKLHLQDTCNEHRP